MKRDRGICLPLVLHLNECGENKGRNISAVYDSLVHSSLLADFNKTNIKIFLKKKKARSILTQRLGAERIQR